MAILIIHGYSLIILEMAAGKEHAVVATMQLTSNSVHYSSSSWQPQILGLVSNMEYTYNRIMESAYYRDKEEENTGLHESLA